jgi:hypothetical protein
VRISGKGGCRKMVAASGQSQHIAGGIDSAGIAAHNRTFRPILYGSFQLTKDVIDPGGVKAP